MRALHQTFLHSAVVLCINFLAVTATAQTNFWEQTNGPYGGIVPSLAINADGHIFAGTDGAGVFRSMNNGDSWTSVNTGLTIETVNALAINSSGHIFAGISPLGVYRSTNNGESWTQVNSDLTNGYVRSLAINSNGDVFAGTLGSGIFRSTNSGDSWTLVSDGLKNAVIQSLAVNPASQDIFAAALYIPGGVFRSTNNGDDWSPATIDLTIPYSVRSLAINASGHIFAGMNGGGIYRSMNNGDSWTPVNNGLNNNFVNSLVINPATQDVFVGTYGGGVFRSINNGDSWMPINTGLTNTDIWPLAINASGHIFAGTSVGVFRSTNNGDSWTAVNAGLTDLNVQTLVINSSGHIFAGTSSPSDKIFRSTNNGDSWVPVYTGSTNTYFQSLAINANGHIFAGTDFFEIGVLRSTDNGDSWAPVNTGLTNLNVQTLAINSSGYIFAGTRGGGVFRSVKSTIVPVPTAPTLVLPLDGALNQPTTLTLNWNPSTNAERYRLQVSTSSDFSTIVVDDSTITTTSRQIGPLVDKTTYYWRVNAKNIGGTSAYSEIRRFTTIALPSQVVLLSPAHAAILPSDNVKFTWQKSQPEINRYWFEIAADSSMANAVKDSTLKTADTSKVVLQLLNKQTYWWRVRAGNAAGWGPFSEQRRFSIDVPTGVEDVTELPTEFSLSQNYPNPFNPSTTIAYALPQPSHVVLKVYDVLGNEVRTLVNDKQPAGHHRVQLDAKNLPGGVYFYRMQAGDFVQTQKLILVK